MASSPSCRERAGSRGASRPDSVRPVSRSVAHWPRTAATAGGVKSVMSRTGSARARRRGGVDAGALQEPRSIGEGTPTGNAANMRDPPTKGARAVFRLLQRPDAAFGHRFPSTHSSGLLAEVERKRSLSRGRPKSSCTRLNVYVGSEGGSIGSSPGRPVRSRLRASARRIQLSSFPSRSSCRFRFKYGMLWSLLRGFVVDLTHQTR
jgi:hypothetical protein